MTPEGQLIGLEDFSSNMQQPGRYNGKDKHWPESSQGYGQPVTMTLC